MNIKRIAFVFALFAACYAQPHVASPSRAQLAPPGEPGERLHLTGHVLGGDGRPIPNAEVYAYHTDARGLYRADGGSGEPRLKGTLRTAADGSYTIDTIKPAPYPGTNRGAHIHFRIMGGSTVTLFLDGGQPLLKLTRNASGVWLGAYDFHLASSGAPAPATTTTRYLVRPTYSNVGFSIVKWGVLKEEGVFRDFSGTLDFDPSAPERSRIDVVVKAASLDTKNENRDGMVRSSDFLDVERYPTMEFHSTGVQSGIVSGDLTIHGATKRVQFRPAYLGVRDLPNVGKLAGFETTFNVNRRDFGVLGTKWGAIPGVLDDDVQVHIVVGAIKPVR